MWEGLARQASIEHLPRSRTRGSSISDDSEPNEINSPRPGNAFRRQPTALSAVSIAEGDERVSYPLAAPVAWPPEGDVPVPRPTENDRRASDTSSQTLAGDQEHAATAEKPQSGTELNSDPEKQRTSKGEQTGGQPGDSLGKRLSKRISKKKTEKDHHDDFEIILADNPKLDPHNWNTSYRWFLTAFVGLLVLNATFASSAPSNLLPSIITYYGVSQLVGILTISLFVAGYMLGPLIWGPLSERYGRRLIFLISFVPYIGFQIGCALSPNIGALLAFRFLGGAFASSPLTNSGGVIADLWGPDQRGTALAIFSLMPFAGPAIAPVVSGALQVTGTDWQWIMWILTIFAGVCFVGIIFLLPETYIPYILHTEAKRRRKKTGDDRWWTESEHPGRKESLSAVLDRTIFKPFKMIVQEPMLLILTLYMSFIYGLIYLLFEAIPIVAERQHGLNALKSGLIFIALPVGGFLAVLLYIFGFNKRYMRLHHERKPRMVPPEERLFPIMLAAPLLAASFFIFGWTAYPRITIWAPIIAIGILGFTVLFVFLGIFTYIIDAYLQNAASALAINTVVRSSFGAGFPLFATQMYNKLGTPGASSLLGGLAIVFIPAPFVLYKYGRKIREMSKHAKVMD